MTRLWDMSVGRFDELKRTLAEAGLDGDLAGTLIFEPELARDMVFDVRHRIARRHPRLFRAMDKVCDAFLMQAERRMWPISINDRARLAEKIRMLKDIESKPSAVFSLDIWLGDLTFTIKELLSWIQSVHTQSVRFVDFPDTIWWQFQLTEAVAKCGRYGGQPFVAPVIIDLAGNTGRAPRESRSSNSAGFEALTALAVHPFYLPRMDGKELPHILLPALEILPGGSGTWSRVPALLHDPDRHELALRVYPERALDSHMQCAWVKTRL